MSWNIKPSVMIGHSVGEYIAACLAGVFTLENVLELIAFRGKLIQSLDSGKMLAISKHVNELDLRNNYIVLYLTKIMINLKSSHCMQILFHCKICN